MFVVLKDFVSWDLNFASGPVIFAVVVVVDFVILPCERSKEWSRKFHQEKKTKRMTLNRNGETGDIDISDNANLERFQWVSKKTFCCVVDMLICVLSCVELP